MKTLDAIAQILQCEGVENFFCYPVNAILESTSAIGIRGIVCRQERVGAGIADGYARVLNGEKLTVFGMQAGPGAENAFSGIATAYSDSTPMLVLPMGYGRAQANWPRVFNSSRAYEPITKWSEQILTTEQVPDAMRRAISRLRIGRPGPVLLEIPADIARDEVPDELVAAYQPVAGTRSAADARDVEEAIQMALAARTLVIHAGQGVLYSQATDELVALAEKLQAPVMTSLLGKSAFPENHPLALGTAAWVRPGPVAHYLEKADVILGVGCSFSRHMIANSLIPQGKTLIQITNDESDVNKSYAVKRPLIGDAKLVLRQMLDVLDGVPANKLPAADGSVQAEIKSVYDTWVQQWMPKLTSDEVPINPYRVVWELMHTIPPEDAILTHDSGSPREQMIPIYRAGGPRSYIGWGKSHGLGTGLGLAMGAKVAAPDKVVMNWLGDAAFGMVGLDFETAVRCKIPIITLLSNNYMMAVETPHMQVSTKAYRSTDISGNYADLARSLGGYSERIEKPGDIRDAILRARKVTETEGRPALIEFITCGEVNYSRGERSM